MKTLLSTFVSFIALCSVGQATSLHPHTWSILSLTVSPLHQSKPSPAHFEKVSIHPNGDVVYQKRGLTRPTTKIVKQLNSYQIDRLYRLIEESKKGAMVSPKLFCLAIPTEHRSYTAENGSQILKQASYPCGALYFNNSQAAFKLEGILEKYLALGRE